MEGHLSFVRSREKANTHTKGKRGINATWLDGWVLHRARAAQWDKGDDSDMSSQF